MVAPQEDMRQLPHPNLLFHNLTNTIITAIMLRYAYAPPNLLFASKNSLALSPPQKKNQKVCLTCVKTVLPVSDQPWRLSRTADAWSCWSLSVVEVCEAAVCWRAWQPTGYLPASALPNLCKVTLRYDVQIFYDCKNRRVYCPSLLHKTNTEVAQLLLRKSRSYSVDWKCHTSCWRWLFQTWKFWWFACSQYVLMYLPDGANVYLFKRWEVWEDKVGVWGWGTSCSLLWAHICCRMYR